MATTRVKSVPIIASANLAAPAGSVANIWDYEVPVRTLLVFQKFGNELNVPGNWGLLRWEVLVNGQLLTGFEAIRDQRGYGAQAQECKHVRIPGGSAILIRGVQESGAACRIGVSLIYDLEDLE